MKTKVSLLITLLFFSASAASIRADETAQIVEVKEGQDIESTFDTTKEKIIFRLRYGSDITQLINADISGPEGKVEIRVTPGGASALKIAAKKKKKKKGKKAFRTAGRSWFAKMTLNGGTKLKDSFKLENGFDIPPPPDSGDDDDDVVGDDDDDDNGPPAGGTFTPSQICNLVKNAIVDGMQDHPDFVDITPNSAKQDAITAFAYVIMREEVPECFTGALTFPTAAASSVTANVKALIYQPQKNISFVIDLIIAPVKEGLSGTELYSVKLSKFGPKNISALNKLSESTHRWLQLQPSTGLFGEIYHRIRFKGSVPVGFATYEVRSYFGGYGYLYARDDSGTNEPSPFLSVLVSKGLGTPFRAIVFPPTRGRWELNWPG